MEKTETPSLVLDKDRFNNLLAMLDSVDEQNVIVALSALEELDFSLNRIKIILLKKLSKSTGTTWKKHAPKLADKLGNYFDLESILTYKHIVQIIKNEAHLFSKEDVNFFLDYFEEYLKTQIHALGYAFVRKVTLQADDFT